MNLLTKSLFFPLILILLSLHIFNPESQAAPPPPSVILSATPDTILSGNPSTLTWSTKKADSITIDPQIGSVGPSGTIEVIPTVTTIYTITATGATGTSTASTTVTVTRTNTSPGATDDAATVDEDSSVSIDVINNDADEDGDTLSIESISQPTNGTIGNNGDGMILYTPRENFNGQDIFTYIINDGKGGTDSATVSITINPVNDDPVAHPQSVNTMQDTSLTVTLAGTDIDEDYLTYTVVTNPQNGTISGNPPHLSYLPNNGFTGTDSLIFTVSDGTSGSLPATITIEVARYNSAPIAADDVITTDEDFPVTISNVLANDTDPDGDQLALITFTPPTNGALAANGDGTFTYTPDPDFFGIDSFTYTIDDGYGGADTASVTITVNAIDDQPVAVNDFVEISINSQSNSINALANDFEPDGDQLYISSYTQPEHGSVTKFYTGALNYAADYYYLGPDSFSYTISDSSGNTSTATVNIEIVPVIPTKYLTSPGGTHFDTGKTEKNRIIRTLSGIIYYFTPKGYRNSEDEGWVDVAASLEGKQWETASQEYGEWKTGTKIGAAIDSENIVHVIFTDWRNNLTYQKFHTKDSKQGDHSWDNMGTIAAGVAMGSDSIAIDANDIPHILYTLQESIKGKKYTTLHYANRIGGIWNHVPVIPVEERITTLVSHSIAIGPDNIPYILTNTSIYKADANNPSYFSEAITGGTNSSFVIHQNGDVRIGMDYQEHYAHYIHDHNEPWNTGWTLNTSGQAISGTLTLLNDIPYTLWASDYEIIVQKEFEDPVTLARTPYFAPLRNVKCRWSYYNFHYPNIIDIATDSWQIGALYYWYTNFSPASIPLFSADKTVGKPPLAVRFTDHSQPAFGSIIVGWEWDFNNDGKIDSTSNSPSSFVYYLQDLYSVSLSVTDSLGNRSTLTMPDYILVDVDNDNDSILNSDDNCPDLYNLDQVDLDGDGIGFYCDNDVALLKKAIFHQGISSSTAMDINTIEITSVQTDGLFDFSNTIIAGKNNYDVISLEADIDSTQVKETYIRIYINSLEESGTGQIRIFAYDSDRENIQNRHSLDFYVTSGWNNLNVSELLPYFDGYGFIKFRLVTLGGWINIAESSITGNSSVERDPWVITASPQEVNFGAVNVGELSRSEITVKNTGSGSLQITTAGTSSPFKVLTDNCSGITLPQNEACILAIGFGSLSAGTYTAPLQIHSNDHDAPIYEVKLVGTTTLSPKSSSISGTITSSATGEVLPETDITLYLSRIKNSDDFPAHSPEIDSNDDIKYWENQYEGRQIFTFRNLFSVPDQVKLTWNGAGGETSDYIAGQSFINKTTGKLTKVSLFLSRQNDYAFARVYIKTRLGGEKESILAESNRVGQSVITNSPTWVEFTFNQPVTLTQGETYYLELYGGSTSSAACGNPYGFLYWYIDSSTPYPDGIAYQRTRGIWDALPNNHAFRTFIDDQLDVQSTDCTTCPSTSKTSIRRYDSNTMLLYAFNNRLNRWETLTSFKPESGYDDTTIDLLLTENLSDYFDDNGWMSVMYGYSSTLLGDRHEILGTDLFTYDFIDVTQTKSNDNGDYSFTGLLGGEYSLKFSKSLYNFHFAKGILAPGENKIENVALANAPPLDVNITYPADGSLISYRYPYFTVSGTASNSIHHVIINDVERVIDTTESFSVPIYPKYGGDYPINVTVTDEFGQTKTQSIMVRVDAGTIQGVITHEASGMPIPNAQMTFMDYSTSCNQADFSKSATTNSEGFYSILVPTGCVWIKINTPGYYFASGGVTSEIGVTNVINFTLRREPPVVFNFKIADITTNSANFSWETNIEATAKLEYGKTTQYGNIVDSIDLSTIHNFALDNLVPGTTYYYRIISTNTDNAISTFTGQFTTLGPTISLISNKTEILPGDSVTLSWTSTNADACALNPGNVIVDCNSSLVVTPQATTTYTLSATNSEAPQPVTDSVTVTVNWPLPVVTFTADMLDVPMGGPAALSWETAYAQTIILEPGTVELTESGSMEVTPTATTTYTITATGPGGATVENLTITIHPHPTVAITASSETILAGNTSTLNWTHTDATSVSITPDIGDVTTLSSLVVSPAETTTYIITATGLGGSASASVTVNVTYPQPTVNITASPMLIQANEPVSLSWSSAEADTVSIDHGVGEVSLTGTYQVTPAVTTLYTITASGRGGTAVGWVRVFVGEQEVGYFYGDPTPAEQAHLETINRARANPETEAERLGIDLYEGLPEGTINGVPRQPLVMNSHLLQAAALHAQDMIDHQFFAHVSPTDGRDPYTRMTDAGYQYRFAAENIGGQCPDDGSPAADAALAIHGELFIDAGVEGRGHRLTLLDNRYKEIGVGMATGPYTGDPNCYMLTADFAQALAETRSFITGVVYDDTNGNGQYDAGEGIGNAVLDIVEAGQQTTTASAGGYGIPVAPGTYTLVATLPGGFEVTRGITISDQNVKVDFLYEEFGVEPPTVDFTSDVATIAAGDSATLAWNSHHGYSIILDNGIGTVPGSGSLVVSPAETTTYTITVTGLAGTVTKSITITVSDSPLPTLRFNATPEIIPIGGHALLSWNSYYADACEISPDIGAVSTSGSLEVTPAATTAYTLTCTGPGGTALAGASVSYPLPVVQLSAQPVAILAGQTTDLSWQVSDATTVTMDNGIGLVAASGTQHVTPAATTAYTITAVGPGGTSTDTVTVDVLDQQALGVGITTPADGAILSRPFTMVQGIVTPGDAEVGITINGFPAQRLGNSFFTTSLPLVEGENKITATATAPDGITVEDSVTIYVDSSQATEWIDLELVPLTGIAPFLTTLTAKLYLADTTGISSTLTYNGPGSIVITQVSPTEYDLEVVDPGLYNLNYTVANGQGGQFEQSIPLVVYSEAELDALLRPKWENMKQALISGDITTALSYVHSSRSDAYTKVFTDLSGHFGTIFNSTSPAEFVEMEDDTAKFIFDYEVEMNGSPMVVSSYVIFNIDYDGLWKITFF